MIIDVNSVLGLIPILFFMLVLLYFSRKNMGFGYKTILGMVFGIILGIFFKDNMGYVSVVGKIYINFITVIVVPLLFISVISSIFSLEDVSKLRSIGGKSIFWLILSTILGAILGLLFAIIFKVGYGLIVELPTDYIAKEIPDISNVIINLFPQNISQDIANNKIVSIIIFAVLIGLSYLYVSKDDNEKSLPFKNLVFSLQAILNKGVLILVELTPYAVLSLMANAVSKNSLDSLLPLIKIVFISYLACLIHLFIINGLLIKFFAKLSPIKFFKKMFIAIVTAFTSQSSLGTLPVTLECLNKLGVSKSVSSFTAPLGTTMGMPGCSGIWPVILAVVSINVLNIDYSIWQYVLLILITGLVSIGTVGVPGTATITATAIFAAVGLPIEIIVITAPISVIVDMARTATNVTSAAAATILVASSENEIDILEYNK